MGAINERYTIKEASEITGFKPHVIRYYEKEFDLDIPRTNSNRRYFTYKETAQFQYIKKLQEKGLSNKQIKKVFKSSVDADDAIETLENLHSLEPIVPKDSINDNLDVHKTSKDKNASESKIFDSINNVISLIQELNYQSDIKNLSSKIDAFKKELSYQEKDILISENAKLKMKIKERSYEIAELKEKLKREQFKKRSFFSKLFINK